MKKLLIALACWASVFAVPITAYAAKDSTDTYEYELQDGKAVLTEYATTSNATRIEIPQKIDGYDVIGLDGTFQQNQRIESVVIPDGVEFLGYKTFSQARKLEQVTLPNGIQKIDNRCFEQTAIETIELPDSIKIIGPFCFQLTNIKSIQVPSSIEEMNGAFRDCENLESVDMSKTSIKDIATNAFHGCEKLNTIILPDTIQTIGMNAFAGCRSLENINIPDCLEEIGPLAFNNCNSLKSINLPQTVKKIDYSAFSSCNSFEEFVIPNQVNELGTLVVSGDNLKYIINMSNRDYDKTVYEHDYDNDSSYIGEKEYTWYLDKEFTKEAEYLPANSTIYRKKNNNSQNDGTWSKDPLVNDYLKKYLDVLIELNKTGISMSEVNSIGQAYEYIKSLAPDGKDDKLFITVEINETVPQKDIFKKAVAGTKENPNGEMGWFHAWINIRNLSNNANTTIGRTIPIWATPYKTATSNTPSRGSGSSRGSSSSSSTVTANNSLTKTQGIQTSKPNIILGIWEQINGKWRLKISDGSYAFSQWAYLGDKWYFLGNDGYMLTGWQMVNGKWYYMDTTGAMMADTVTPDGYRVNQNGEWVN